MDTSIDGVYAVIYTEDNVEYSACYPSRNSALRSADRLSRVETISNVRFFALEMFGHNPIVTYRDHFCEV